MKDLFPGYYLYTDDEFKNLWEQGTFILDTNFILDLYRLPQETTKEIWDILKRVSNRLWIPHHVALEYQRNRLNTISTLNKSIDEFDKLIKNIPNNLKSDIDKIRHPEINAETAMTKLNFDLGEIQKYINKIRQTQINVTDIDKIRSNFDSIIQDNIGSSPNQEWLNNIFEEGKERYKHSVPPGYKDQNKNKKGNEDTFFYGGNKYISKFGDLIIWKQIIDFAKENNLEHIILLTNDSKSDWWNKVDSDKPKTIGPAPNLLKEIKDEAGVNCFWIYKTSGLLKYSQKYFQFSLSPDLVSKTEEFERKLHPYEISDYATEFLNRILRDNFSKENITVDDIKLCLGALNEGLIGTVLDFELEAMERKKNDYIYWHPVRPMEDDGSSWLVAQRLTPRGLAIKKELSNLLYKLNPS